MKKVTSMLLVLGLLLSLCSCGSPTETTPSVEPSQTIEVTPSPDPTQEPVESSTSFTDLNAGDEVSIVGQKANGTLVNENTIWVQVTKEGERTVVYHCQLKDEFLKQGESLKMLDVVKVKGCFLSASDMAGATETATTENTAIIVTLYDCEIL